MTHKNNLQEFIFNVDYEDFEVRVIEASRSQPVLVDLWAEWCAPCRVIAPTLERVIAERLPGLRLAKVEVDEGENMKLAGHYRVRGFPTLLLFVDGEERARFSGNRPRHFIHEWLDRHLGD